MSTPKLIHHFPTFEPRSSVMPQKPFLCFFLCLTTFLALNFATAPNLAAAVTATNWVIAVNADSISSRTIANHYAAARNIPERNVIVLQGVPDSDKITVDQFRELILAPLLETINQRGLTNQIQGIAYSADFPTAIDIQSDIASIPNKSPYLTPVGSINGLTYLYRQVMAKDPSYIGFESNLYAAQPASRLFYPLLSSADQAKALKQFIDDAKHREAAELLSESAQALEKAIAFPMQYLAAQQWAKAGEVERAMKMLAESIRNGWSYREHLLNDPAFASMLDNKDFQRVAKRCAEQKFDYLPSRSFDARTFYSLNTLGSSNAKHGSAYLLSMTLAVTRDLGVTRPEAIRNLELSVNADFTQPEGEFVFCKTGDVRTTTREPNFALAIEALKARGKRAGVVESAMPVRGSVCAGVMMGTATFAWAGSGATLVPGAIADNLTSLGGAMTTNSQTKCTEFLRYGAAVSSGAVTEPYSIQNKFPHPMIHVHYVDGLTAAEAFYSSVTCPYQLLIVGDPLCRPYANPARFTLQHQLNQNQLSVSIQLQDPNSEPDTVQVLVDGVLRGRAAYEPKINLKLDGSKQGACEIRIVVSQGQRVQQSFEQTLRVQLNPKQGQKGTPNQQLPALEIQGPESWRLHEEKPLMIVCEKRETDISVFHGAELLGTIQAGETSLQISPNRTGYGPVQLHAKTQGPAGGPIESDTISILVEP